MSTFFITNRPSGSHVRSIAAIIQNFDDIITLLNNKGVENSNLGDYAVTASKIGVLPAASCTNNNPTTITPGSGTSLPFTSELFDTDGIHDNVTNNNRLTCRTDGLYLVMASVEITFGVSDKPYSASLNLSKNGSSYQSTNSYMAWHIPPTYEFQGTGRHGLSLTTLVQLSVNDYLALSASHTHPTANPQVSGVNSSRFTMVFLGK